MSMNRSKAIGSIEFMALVASILMLTAMAIDIMLPTFDDLRDHFDLGSESTATARIVTFFFIGQIGQLFFGPLSDRYGRLRILRVGFGLYITGCVAAALSPTLTLMFGARFVVGMGSSAMMVSAMASIRDRFVGDKMAQTMSLILTIFLLVPIFAPLLGSIILEVSSWQVVFLTPPTVAVFVFVWSFRLNESLSPEQRSRLDWATLSGSVRHVMGNRIFLRYTVITTILFSAFISFISSSERIITEIYDRPDLFVLIFSGTGVLLAIFSFSNAQLVSRFGARRTTRGLLATYWILASLLIVLALLSDGTPQLLSFVVLVAVIQGINVMVRTNSGAMALEPIGAEAGMAAAIYGTSFLVVGSLMASVIDGLLVNSIVPLALAYFVQGLIANGLAYTHRIRIEADPLQEPQLQHVT